MAVIKSMSKNFDLNELENAVKNGKAEEFLNKNVSRQTAEKIKSVLNSKEATEKLLNTKEAKELMKKFLEGKK